MPKRRREIDEEPMTIEDVPNVTDSDDDDDDESATADKYEILDEDDIEGSCLIYTM